MSLTELVSPNKSLSPLWVKEKDFWSSNLSVDQWIFLIWELWEKKRNVSVAGMLKMGLIRCSVHCLPEHDEKPSTIQSLPQAFHFHPPETGTATDICVKNISKEIQPYLTLVLGNTLFAELLHFPY